MAEGLLGVKDVGVTGQPCGDRSRARDFVRRHEDRKYSSLAGGARARRNGGLALGGLAEREATRARRRRRAHMERSGGVGPVLRRFVETA